MTSKICKIFFILGIITSFASCNKEDGSAQSSLSTQESASSAVSSGTEDFSDLEKKKDESCDTTEDLEKKIEEKAKKQEAFKLQGGDPGCTTD